VLTGLALTTGPAAAGASVSIVDLDFTPRTVSVAAGTTLSWTYVATGTNQHTVTADNGAFASPVLAPGQSFQHTFTVADAGRSFAYHCSIHNRMQAIVVVTPSSGGSPPDVAPGPLPADPPAAPEPTAPTLPPTTAAVTTTSSSVPPTTQPPPTTTPPIPTSEPPSVSPFSSADVGMARSVDARKAPNRLLVGAIGAVLAAIGVVAWRLRKHEDLTRPGQ